MQRIDYILTKKRNFNEIFTMFMSWEKGGGLLYINVHIKISLANILWQDYCMALKILQ